MKTLLHNALKFYLRHFPISKGKSRIFSALWKPFSFGEYHREATLLQANVKLNCDLTKFLQRYLYFFGGYEEEYCALWMKLAKSSSTIFDAGSNIGLYSLLATSANPLATIHAFEPTPEIVETFKKNLQLNGMRNVIVNVMGIGKQVGQAVLQKVMGGGGIYDGMNFISAAATPDNGLPISVTSLDEYCRQNQIVRIDLIKMDIEGGEYDALEGARQLLNAQAIGCIFLELVESLANRSGHSTVDIKRILYDAGYQVYQLQSGSLTVVSPEKIHEGQGDNVIACASQYKLEF